MQTVQIMNTIVPPIKEAAIREVFASCSSVQQTRLLELRSLIYTAANNCPGTGTLVETLKWGQPSYVTVKPKSGSTIRIDAIRDKPASVGLYFICTTSLVDTFRQLYPDDFRYEGNRAMIFSCDEELPVEKLSHCLSLALTYHVRK